MLGSVLSLILVFIPFPGSRFITQVIDTFIALPTFLITLAFTFIYGSAGLLNGTLMALFDFELPPVDFLYSINGVILARSPCLLHLLCAHSWLHYAKSIRAS